jgi:hypothetical protein
MGNECTVKLAEAMGEAAPAAQRKFWETTPFAQDQFGLAADARWGAKASFFENLPNMPVMAWFDKMLGGLKEKASETELAAWGMRAAQWLSSPLTMARQDPTLARVVGGTSRAQAAWTSLWNEAAVESTAARAALRKSPEQAQKLVSLYASMPDASPQAFEDAAAALGAEAVAAVRAWRPIAEARFKRMQEAGLIEEGAQPVVNYLPMLREKRRVSISDRFDIQESGSYIPDQWSQVIPERARAFMLNNRKMDDLATYLSWNDLIGIHDKIYTRALVQQRYLDQLAPLTQGPGAELRRDTGILDEIPKRYRAWAAAYVNNFLGVPTAGSERVRSSVGLIKELEAARTLGMNPGFLAGNKLQVMDAMLLGVSPKNIGLGVAKGATLEIENLAKAAGLLAPEYQSNAAADIAAGSSGMRVLDLVRRWVRGDVDSALGKATSPLWWVQQSESGMFGNIRQVFAAGLYEGKERGLRGQDLVEFARDIVVRSQYSQETTRKALAFRPGEMGQMSPVFELAGQMKDFSIARMGLIRDALQHRPVAAAKWLVGLGVLMGTDAIWPGLSEEVTYRLFGEAMRVPGMIPYVGAALAERVGLNLDPDEIRRFFFWLPGPAAGHVADLATALDYGLRGEGGWDFGKILRGDFSGSTQGLSPDRAAQAAARSLPVAGVFADRLRNYAKQLRTGGDLRVAQDFWQALGVSDIPSGAELLQRFDPAEAEFAALGLSPDRITLERRSMDVAAEYDQARRRQLTRVNRLFMNDPEAAVKQATSFAESWGVPLELPKGEEPGKALREALVPRGERKRQERLFKGRTDVETAVKRRVGTTDILELLK